MKPRLFDFVRSWPAVGGFFVVFVVCTFAFGWRSKELGGNETLDVQMALYGPVQAHELLSKLHKIGKLNLYAVTELTLDVVFPVAYVALMAGLIGNLYPAPRAARRLAVVPVLAGLAD